MFLGCVSVVFVALMVYLWSVLLILLIFDYIFGGLLTLFLMLFFVVVGVCRCL